jgi:hypothetical protein
MAKLERCCTYLRDNPLCARSQMHRFATPIVWRIFSRDPTVAFQPMQQRYQSRFFNAEV